MYATIGICSAIGYALAGAAGAATDAATLSGVVGAVVLNLFGGFVPMVGTYGGWAYTHWSQRAFAAIELTEGYGLDAATFNMVVPKEWRDSDWRTDVGVLFAMTALTSGIAVGLTASLYKDKQK